VSEDSADPTGADPTGGDTVTQPVVVRRDEAAPAVAVITLNRPDRRNALTRELKDALVAAVTEVAGDGSVRAVVLTGSGRAFCVGQDLREHAEALRAGDGREFDTVDRHYNPVVRALVTMPKPVVAAINGACVGAGLGFALACDLRVAAAGTSFATAFAAIGLTADSGLSATLARSVGAARAGELLLLGEPFSAEQAAQWGLVRSVVPPEQVLDAALALARTLAAGPTLAYAEIKQALARSAVAPLDEVLAIEAAGQARLGGTKDHLGAVEAFLAKQKPIFEGS
jgi:2-(1,2-epoxy-1,2-dihydrophenyl)acetyl-CoA isomerase